MIEIDQECSGIARIVEAEVQQAQIPDEYEIQFGKTQEIGSTSNPRLSIEYGRNSIRKTISNRYYTKTLESSNITKIKGRIFNGSEWKNQEILIQTGATANHIKGILIEGIQIYEGKQYTYQTFEDNGSEASLAKSFLIKDWEDNKNNISMIGITGDKEKLSKSKEKFKRRMCKATKATVTEDNDNAVLQADASDYHWGALLQTDLNEICGYTHPIRIQIKKGISIPTKWRDVPALVPKTSQRYTADMLISKSKKRKKRVKMKLQAHPRKSKNYITGNEEAELTWFPEQKYFLLLGRKTTPRKKKNICLYKIHIQSPEKKVEKLMIGVYTKADLKELSRLPSKLLSGEKLCLSSEVYCGFLAFLWNAKDTQAYYPAA
ncbi:hypothetical protein H5410_013619 [Solanum commersonii]|uniref:Uncharacterized protein n=1 Tax=Solanum commersonii TaxID=4109 RepID=A0A9J5ZNW1_SOLCO|nr:hypothetical protein H5410_013619 [Solanum commersonii]